MPLYDFKCEDGHQFELFVPLEKFAEPVFCSCQKRAKRLISAPLFTVDYTGYHCPITNKWIGSKAQHRENLKAHGCRVLEAGETENVKKTRQEEEAAFDRKIEESVEKELSTWSSDKMEKLSNELVNGKVDAEVTRK